MSSTLTVILPPGSPVRSLFVDLYLRRWKGEIPEPRIKLPNDFLVLVAAASCVSLETALGHIRNSPVCRCGYLEHEGKEEEMNCACPQKENFSGW